MMSEQSRDAGAKSDRAAPEISFDPSKVLVIGRSHVTRVVVASIVEKSGLKVAAALPEEAEALLLDGPRPGTLVLDGGVDNCECDALANRIVSLRRASGRAAPAVVLLSNRNLEPPFSPSPLWPAGAIDAVVAKPITPERLQLVVGRLRDAQQ